MKTVALCVFAATVLLVGVLALAQAPMPFSRLKFASAPAGEMSAL